MEKKELLELAQKKYDSEKVEFWTEEQKESLKLALKKYDSEKVEMFIDHITQYCEAAKATLERPKITDDKVDKKKMIGCFRRAIAELKLIGSEKIMLDYFRVAFQEWEGFIADDGTIVSGFDEPLLFSADDYYFWKESGKAQDALEKLVKMIEDNLEKTSRPIGARTKADPMGLIEVLATIFSIYFGKPTASAEGPFANVVRITHDALGLPSKDLSRGIAKALKSYLKPESFESPFKR